MPGTGFELSDLKASKTPISKTRGAKSGVHDAPNPPKNLDLDIVVKAWPELPEYINVAIKALIQTCKAERK